MCFCIYPKNRNNYYLDNLDTTETNQIEKEADKKSEEILKVKEIIKYSEPYVHYFSEVILREIADKLNIDAALILGILQYHKLIDYRKLARYKKKVLELFPEEVVMG